MSSFEIYVKSSSGMITKKLETARRKKQALDDLFNEGKISQMTYEYISKDLDDGVNEIEGHQKVLADRIASKINELEEQTRTLEMFLADLALGHAVGEITDDLYKSESKSLALGLENAKRELTNLRDTLLSAIPEQIPAPVPEPTEEVEAPAPEEVEAPAEEPVAEEPSELPVEEPIETDVLEEVAEETEEPIEETVEAPAEEEAAVEETPVEEAAEEITEEVPTAEGEVYFEAPSEDMETSAEETDVPEEMVAE